MVGILILVIAAYFFFRSSTWYIFAGIIALIVFLLIRTIAKSKRAARAAHQLAHQNRIAALEQAKREEEERQRQEEQARQEKLKRPIDPPKAQNGYSLSYFYPDVAFNVPPEYEEAARAVPPHEKLSLSYGDNDDEILLSYNGSCIGSMYNNRLRQMVHDYARDDDHDMLAASCYWTDKPIFSLAFYLSADYIESMWEDREGFKKTTLIGNSNAEMQDNIELLVVGDPISISWDSDSERYAAFDRSSCIGFLPSKLDDYAEANTLDARVIAINEKENGKKAVQIMMIPD